MISIIGAGRLGAQTAAFLAQAGIREITLVDRKEKLAIGESRDLNEAFPTATLYGGSDYALVKNSKVVIITAGMARTPGQSRHDIFEINTKIVESILEQVHAHAPEAVVVIATNPIDTITLRVTQSQLFAPEKIIGSGSLLDSMRFQYFLAKELAVSPTEVECFVLGEHGDSMVLAWSQVCVSGKEKYFSKEVQAEIEKKVRGAGAFIIEHKSATIYAPAVSLSNLVLAIYNDTNECLPVSTLLTGEYNLTDVCLGVPCTLGKNGVQKIEELKLSDEELEKLVKSATVITSV